MNALNKKTIMNYLNAHFAAMNTCLQRLKVRPLANIITLVVITIALMLPTGFYLVFTNLNKIGQTWDHGAQISVYLQPTIAKSTVDELMAQLKNNVDIATVEYISPEQGLKEFTQATNTEDVLQSLKDNPLPATIIITPKFSIKANEHMISLRDQLSTLPQILDVKLDNMWISRLDNILILLEKFLIGLSFVLGLGVIFIIFNSVQSVSQKYHKEVVLYQLIGATRGYIRRPFLYTGIVFGIIGSILSIITLSVFIFWLNPQILHLEALYQNQIPISGLTFKTSLIMMLIASILGYIGAFVAISSEIRKKS